jgi:5-methylthioadenosine/S-adenosylhomocysteine deaminase
MKQKLNLPLINVHSHAAMVAFRGIAEDKPLDEWLTKHIWPAEAKFVKPDFVYKNTKKAIKEMKANGIKAFCDMYFFEDEVARAAIEEKMPVVIGECIIDFPSPSAKNPEIALSKTEELIIKYQNNPYVKVSVAPHSIQTVSKDNLIKAKKLAKKHNILFQIHLAETKKEFDESLKKYKMTPVEYLESLKILDENTLLHHCVWLTNQDIKILSKRKVHIVHCPLSNLKLGSGIAPISKIIEANINVALGTDSAASSNRLDIWEAGKFASLLQKGVNLNPEKIPAKKVIEMMSINGMKALGFSEIDNYNINSLSTEIDSQNFDYIHEHHVENLDIDF